MYVNCIGQLYSPIKTFTQPHSKKSIMATLEFGNLAKYNYAGTKEHR